MVRSPDGGQTWQPVGPVEAIDLHTYYQVMAVSDKQCMAAIRGANFYLSADHGVNWSKISDGIFADQFTSMTWDAQVVYVATLGSGIVRSSFSECKNVYVEPTPVKAPTPSH